MVIFRWAGLSHLIWARLFPRAIGDSVSALQCVRLSTLSLTLLHLGSIENYGINKINVASEFVAQYSSRQKYRYPVLPALESSGFNFARENGMCPNFMLFFFFFSLLIRRQPLYGSQDRSKMLKACFPAFTNRSALERASLSSRFEMH